VKFPKRVAVAFACCSIVLPAVGCKRRAATPAVVAPSPATEPPTTSTSRPSTGPITVEFDGEPLTFPPAELRVRPSGTGLLATLATVDAPNSAGGANSLHLDMTFPELANSAELDGAEWHYRERDDSDADKDAAETPEVIELRHGAVALDPAEATATIHLDGEGRATVELSGTFKLFDPPEAGKPSRTPWVTAKVQATVQTLGGGE
jgi:hypothetical protein